MGSYIIMVVEGEKGGSEKAIVGKGTVQWKLEQAGRMTDPSAFPE